MSLDPQRLFDARYYATGCGPHPYQRDEVWLNFFGGIADRVVAGIGPATALDAGCALGVFVECLRDRGVDAAGVDVSEYAISRADERVRPFVRAGSITEPFGARYDLITCIEVLEHLPPEQAEGAIANLCAHADDILFSSTPDDTTEPTHFNVQPPAYWDALFASNNFFRDPTFDATFVTPWAARYRRRPRVLLIAHDVVGRRMAGPGVRYYHLARVLAAALATPSQPLVFALPHESDAQIELPGVRVETYRRWLWDSIAPLAERADVIIFPSDIATDFPQLAGLNACLAVDGYDPLMAEWLALEEGDADARERRWRERMRELGAQMLMGDFFICASERQRDWWLGLLEAHGRVNPRTFAQDRTLRKLVDVVPYGLRSDSPEAHAGRGAAVRRAVLGTWPGIGANDKVLLWGGGLWPWLDPQTAVRALARVWRHRQDVRLVFPGTRHPNPFVTDIKSHTAASRALAREAGLPEEAVYFGDWVPYDDWPAVLMESDLALSLHHDSFETRLAFRSRVLEYLWAGLPVVCTEGDATSDLVARFGVGEVVGYGDDEAVARAILRLLDEPRGERAAQFARAREALTWERGAEPLAAFCRNPHRAADRPARGPAAGSPFHNAALDAAVADLRGRLDASDAALRAAEADARARADADAARAEALARERDQARALVRGYEAGKFIRFMKWLKGR